MSDLKSAFNIQKLTDLKFELIPRKPLADIVKIELTLDKTAKLIYQLSLITKTENETELTFKNVTQGIELSDAMFVFVTPKDTEEIH